MSRKWLVAFDFSPLSEAALDYAVEHLSAGGGEVHLLHVHRPLSTQFATELTAVSPAFGDADATIAEAARRRLQATAAKVTTAHANIVVSNTVTAGYPPDVIVDVAEREQCSQIILGSHGRRGFKRLFLGSVAERVVRHSNRTVVVVKAEGQEASG